MVVAATTRIPEPNLYFPVPYTLSRFVDDLAQRPEVHSSILIRTLWPAIQSSVDEIRPSHQLAPSVPDPAPKNWTV